MQSTALVEKKEWLAVNSYKISQIIITSQTPWFDKHVDVQDSGQCLWNNKDSGNAFIQ